MSFLVMLIMAIVVFILSIYFLAGFFEQSVTLRDRLDSQTQQQIESMLARDARVAIPIDTVQMRPGDSATFGIGVRNTDASRTYFKVELSSSDYGRLIEATDPAQTLKRLICSNGECYVAGYGDNILMYEFGRNGIIDVGVNQQDTVTFALGVYRNAPRGHYIMNVFVCSFENDADRTSEGCDATNSYTGTVHKIHLLVN